MSLVVKDAKVLIETRTKMSETEFMNIIKCCTARDR